MNCSTSSAARPPGAGHLLHSGMRWPIPLLRIDRPGFAPALGPLELPRLFCVVSGARPELSQISESVETTRSEEHTSELQSPYVISYAVFCLKKKTPRATTEHSPPPIPGPD